MQPKLGATQANSSSPQFIVPRRSFRLSSHLNSLSSILHSLEDPFTSFAHSLLASPNSSANFDALHCHVGHLAGVEVCHDLAYTSVCRPGNGPSRKPHRIRDTESRRSQLKQWLPETHQDEREDTGNQVDRQSMFNKTAITTSTAKAPTRTDTRTVTTSLRTLWILLMVSHPATRIITRMDTLTSFIMAMQKDLLRLPRPRNASSYAATEHG